MNTFLHSGQLGDVLAFLPTIQSLGGGNLVICSRPDCTTMKGAKYEALRPLLEAQPYIHSIRYEENPKDVTHDGTGFRKFHNNGEDIVVIQARNLKVPPPGYRKWIHVTPDPRTAGRIVVARSPRYRNYNFPWRKIARRYGSKLSFVGIVQEYEAFVRETGVKVEWLPTRDLLDVARAIEGADFFFGNQSSPFWVAAGLNKPLVLEVCQQIPDCCLPYQGASYPFYGHIDFDSLPI